MSYRGSSPRGTGYVAMNGKWGWRPRQDDGLGGFAMSSSGSGGFAASAGALFTPGLASLGKVRSSMFLEMISGSVSHVLFHPATWSPTRWVKISVLKNASDFSVKISRICPKYKLTCLLIFYSFIFMLFLLVAITTFYYLCLSQILTPGFITLTPLVLESLLSQMCPFLQCLWAYAPPLLKNSLGISHQKSNLCYMQAKLHLCSHIPSKRLAVLPVPASTAEGLRAKPREVAFYYLYI